VDFATGSRENRAMPRGARYAIVLAMALALRAAAAVAAAPPTIPEPVAALAAVAPGLDPHVLGLALDATGCAVRRGILPSLRLLTVIDYTRPSTEPRLWVLDVPQRRLLYRDLVAHGRGSGELYATQFSNDAGSKASSLGLFVTADVYDGIHGRSLRLHGLEPGINDHALERALVMHGADYVSLDFAAQQGRLGRSHGCPALPVAAAPRVIDAIQGGTPLFAYSSDATWLSTSSFLGVCAMAGASPAPAPRASAN
jgi:hypothetical protein